MIAAKKDKFTGDALGTGRRKSSIARVRVRAGDGQMKVNGKPLEDYFVNEQDRKNILEALNAAGLVDKIDLIVRVTGGGMTGQSGAIRMGLARALCSYDEALHDPMREGSFLTRDSRMKERKKPGLRGARRGVQFSKR